LAQVELFFAARSASGADQAQDPALEPQDSLQAFPEVALVCD
jgi:hypothetical protein